jgi:hypothetical protein
MASSVITRKVGLDWLEREFLNISIVSLTKHHSRANIIISDEQHWSVQ